MRRDDIADADVHTRGCGGRSARLGARMRQSRRLATGMSSRPETIRPSTMIGQAAQESRTGHGVKMAQLTPDLIEALHRLDACTVSNAIETFECRLRNEGFADGSIHAVFDDLPPIVGHAVTARIRCSTPPPVGHNYYDRTDWWTYVLTVPPPRIVVVEDVDERPGMGAFVGHVHAQILQSAGMRGVRDERIGPRSSGRQRDRLPVLRQDRQRVTRVRPHRGLRSTGLRWWPPGGVRRHHLWRCARVPHNPGRASWVTFPASRHACWNKSNVWSLCASRQTFRSRDFGL